jgi:hypothetical protein
MFKKAHIEALTKIAPDFIKMQIEAIKSFAKISGNMRKGQAKSTEAISDSINSLSKVLETLASKAQSEASIEKIAELSIKMAEKYTEILEINRKQNKDNNNTWKALLGTVGAVVLAGVGLFLGKRN